LNSYDSVSRNFTATQPNLLADIAGFPSITGQSGKFLSNNGTGLLWGIAPAAPVGIINVQNPPAGLTPATGNGTTDDFTAISAIFSYALNHGGLTVYFPVGRYRVSQNLNIFHAVSILGDNPYLSVIQGDPNISGPVILIASSASDAPGAAPSAAGSVFQNIGVDGGMSRAAQPAPSDRRGIVVFGSNGVYLKNCLVTNCASDGIACQNCYGIVIQDCLVGGVGQYGINVQDCPRSLLFGNIVSNSGLSAIWLINAPYCQVQHNQILNAGPASYGVFCSESDNTVVSGNTIQQCAIGVTLVSSSTRPYIPQSHGYVVSGNNIIRNYYLGLLIAVTNGTQVSGNVFSENGQGGTDHATYTVEPGIAIDLSAPANQGSGYALGDILTVAGGTGTPAKAVVTRVLPGGKIAQDGLIPIVFGTYTAFPANPASVTGGSGAGAKVNLTGLRTSVVGSGHTVGKVLVALNGSYYNPVKIMVTSVDTNGGVTGYQVVDGGGYFGALPTSLSFAADAIADPNNSQTNGGITVPQPIPDPTSNLVLVPSWGIRYAYIFDTGLSSAIVLIGPCDGAILNSNILDANKTGCGLLIFKDSTQPNYSTYPKHLNIIGNSLMGNFMSIRQRDGTSPPAPWSNVDSIYQGNLIFPRDPADGLPTS